MPIKLHAPSLSPVAPGLWRVMAMGIYVSERYGVISVPNGFITDLASVPRVPFVYAAFGGRANVAAVFHDYLYMTKALSRKDADAVFLEIMNYTGDPTNKWERYAMYIAVRLFGWGGYHA